jgi:glycosyltransferase involved in cell wall biosynthesis
MKTAASARAPRRRLLVGTAVHNSHVQNMVKALYETGGLYAYFSGGVDVWHNAALRRVRHWVGSSVPQVGRELSRRAISGIPDDFVRARWRWELPRVLAGRFNGSVRLEDWLWERGEHDLDRLCARVVGQAGVDGFFGVEHGSLRTIEAARAAGKPAVVAFLSPHRGMRERWVDDEFIRHPELGSPGRRYLDGLSEARDARRDDEARLAEWIVSGSSFTTRSLHAAGFSTDKIITIPLGGPDPIPVSTLPKEPPSTLRLVYVGPVSVRKGAHYLLRAWRQIAGPGLELHFYGKPLLPDDLIAEAKASRGGDRLFFHGSVPASTLGAVYLNASLLILPTLCDGFGQVISDALAHGVPVLTTENAGGADCVEPGINGFVIPPADAMAIAERLTWCADHRTALFDMRRPALSHAARWTWTHFRRQFAADVQGALISSERDTRLRALA